MTTTRKILILTLCLLFFASGVLAQGGAPETPSNFSLFWGEVKETFRILFSWDNVEKTKLALDFADKKLEDYKRYRLEQKDELAERSLKRYQKEIEIVLDVLEKESDQKKAEQIAEEVKERTIKSIAELEALYDESPPFFKERISQIIFKLQDSYKISQGIMSGEYKEVFQSKWSQIKAKFREKMKEIYYKLWPLPR